MIGRARRPVALIACAAVALALPLVGSAPAAEAADPAVHAEWRGWVAYEQESKYPQGWGAGYDYQRMWWADPGMPITDEPVLYGSGTYGFDLHSLHTYPSSTPDCRTQIQEFDATLDGGTVDSSFIRTSDLSHYLPEGVFEAGTPGLAFHASAFDPNSIVVDGAINDFCGPDDGPSSFDGRQEYPGGRTTWAGVALPEGAPLPVTISKRRSYVDNSGSYPADVTYQICMTRSTADTDGDGLPDAVDIEPSVPGGLAFLGSPGEVPGTQIERTLANIPDGIRDVPSCPAASDVVARPDFSWEVASQSSDHDADGVMDQYTGGKWSKPLPPTGTFAVTFDACANGGTTQFTVDGVVFQPQCKLTDFLKEGTYTVTVDVLDGPNKGSTTETINVVHHLVVGLGDSFASGETVTPKWGWDNANCRRGRGSAQARAALALENSSPHSTVTFLHLACSGATAKEGLLGPYRNPPGSKKVRKSQIRQAYDLTVAKGWDIDAVLLSLGGNDIGFASVLKTCAQERKCPLTKSRFVPPLGTKTVKKRLHNETMGLLAKLPRTYQRIAGCLGVTLWCTADQTSGLGVAPSRVFVTEYPDLSTKMGSRFPTRDGYSYCDHALTGLSRVKDEGIVWHEFQWAREVLQQGRPGTRFPYFDKKLEVTAPGLNNAIVAASKANGWTPVTGAFDAFRGHGYCAGDKSWITTMKLRYVRGNATAAFHPTQRGYKKWGKIIAGPLVSALE